MNPDIVSQLILAVGLAVVSLFFWGFRELVQVGLVYLKSQVGQTEFDRLEGYASVAVKAVEQSPVYKDFTGDKKKELVKVAISQFAKEHNLPIDDALADKFIESAVQEMNSQMMKIDWTAADVPGLGAGDGQTPAAPVAGTSA